LIRATPAGLPLLELRGLTKVYGGRAVVSDVSLAVTAGEFLSIIGPSGCGKSTLLKMVIGAVQPTSGQVLLRGQDVATLPREKLEVIMVWQSVALFPHMTVGENVGFGLAMRKLPARAIADRVARYLEMMDLPGWQPRRIDQLSGGEQQRVALARALVVEPSVLLLDEPMGGLDKHRRGSMLAKFREIHRNTGVTFVMVTHDQGEAMTTSSRIAILNRGVIEQTGSPEEVSRRPQTAFVARFVGHKNVFSATVVQAEGAEVTVSSPAGPLHAQRPVWSAFRPERGAAVAYVVDAFRVRTGHTEMNRVTGTLDMRSVSGGMEVLEVSVPGLGIVRCERAVMEAEAPPDGSMLSWRPEDAYVLPPE
jgi:ABC-type Fe3+/spermidine/putrescine transport system ATPase subunit